jgi:membrane protein DedA with SNARE-associated domain
MPSLTASVWIMVLCLTLWAGNYFLFDDVLGAEETAVVVFLVALVVSAVRFFWERTKRKKGKS